MIICCNCRVEMVCSKNGAGARFANDTVFSADRLTCPICAVEILQTSELPFYNPTGNGCKEYWDILSAEQAIASAEAQAKAGAFEPLDIQQLKHIGDIRTTYKTNPE